MDDILNGPENGDMFAEGEDGAVALPNFGANGQPQDEAQENKPPKPWELPLKIPDIRKSSNNWSLASDAGLLLYLQEYSQKMIAKTSDLEKQVDGLVSEAKSTDSRVHNVFNDFLMLANTQFIENRVYDDADDLDGEKDSTQSSGRNDIHNKTREQREAEVIPRVTQALSLGINVLDTAFEQLDPHIGDSDSDDEDPNYKTVDPILEPKDLYAHRALPYIIGTPAFMQDDDVGLAFSEEEDELSEEEEDDDEGESELSDESEFSETESSDMEESDTTGTTRSKKGTETKSDSEESDDGDLFGADKSDEEDEGVAKPKAAGYADELAAKLGAAAAAAGAQGGDTEDERQRTISETSSKGKKRKKGSPKERGQKKRGESKTGEDNLFGGGNEVEDEDSPFNKKGLFSASSGGLFDDDEKEEGGLFDEKPAGEEDDEDEHHGDHIYEDIKGVHGHSEPKTTRSGKKIPAGGVALFGAEGEDDLFGTSPQSKEAGVEENIASDVQNLQDKESGRHKEEARKAALKTGGAKGGGGGLFDEDEDDLFGESTSKPTATKKGSKEVDLFGAEDDELFADKPKEAKKEAPQKKLPAGAVSLFGDAPNPLLGKLSPTKTPSDEDEEEQKKTPPVAKKPAAKSAAGAALFDEGGDGDLFASESKPTEKKPSKGSLFEEEDDADIFATPQEPKGNRPKADSSLFDDLEDEGDADDLFSKPKEPVKKKPVGGVALFGDAEVFGSPPKKEPEKPPEIKTPEMRDRRANTLSLFNDDDEKDEIFGASAQQQRQEAKAASEKEEKLNRRRAKSKSVFDDEDVLFGNKNEEDPSIDLFGSGSPVSPEKPQAPEDQIYENADQLKKEALFGDDDDDDLFGESSKPPVVITPKPKETKKEEVRTRGGGLFGEEDEEENLFGSVSGARRGKKDSHHYAESSKKKPANENNSANQEPPTRKKPVGGVAMFGGIDPLNTSAAKNVTSNKPSTPTTPKDAASLPQVDSPSPTTADKPTGFKPVGPPKGKTNRVSALQANLGIDPSALRPGAAPPSRQVESEAIDFDKPAQAKTLDSDITKNRAKMSVKRRPPSRNLRQSAARLSSNPALYSDSISEKSLVPEEAYQDLPSPSQISRTKPKPHATTDLFGSDDLFSDNTPSIPEPEAKRTPPSGGNASKAKSSSSSPFNDKGDDLFASSRLPEKKETKKAVPDFVDDDLFTERSVAPKREKKPISLGVDEDLFASTKKAAAQPPVDDDLFASAPSTTTKKEPKKKPVVEDDDDDLFGEKKPTPKKTKAKKTDKDLFADTTDIFADVPSKPREKKKKKQDPGLFGDVPGDDIFASPSASAAKPKKTKAKKKEKKPASGDDIFSTDAPNIFDDPLSAMKN